MRALCESCSRPQPVDWSPGDRCIWCGETARREVRCFWCTRWTPAAKFCRTCGAATVEPELYGAARMLKDAGTDRFTIPKQLREFDPEQIENFTRIYQEQSVVAAHHVAQAAFLEQHLEQRHWSGSLEDTLTAELPWPFERLEQMRAAAQRVPEQLEGVGKAQAIGASTPFPVTRVLSAIARVAMDDFSACEEAAQCLQSNDEKIRTEAALALSHWRVLYGPGLPVSARAIAEELRRCPLREAAAARLALFGGTPDTLLPPEDFATALATGNVDRLTAAAREGDPLMRYAAAKKLLEMGEAAPAGEVLRTATAERQLDLLRLMERRRKPFPELRDALFAVAEGSTEREVVHFANTVLCAGCDPADALRIARAGRGDSRVYQALLQRAALPPPVLAQLGEFLIAAGAFRADQYGMGEAAKAGRMPADFVQRQWPKAMSEARMELCRFAEMQLREQEDEGIHRFLGLAALTPMDVRVQSEAWSCLYRWYDSFGYPRRRPLAITPESVAFFFGSAANFLTGLARFLDGRGILRESLQRDRIAELLRYPNVAALELFAEAQQETLALAESVADVMRDREIDFLIRLAGADFLGFLGTTAAFRGPMEAMLKTFAGSDLDLQSTRALETMARAASEA